MTLTCIVIDDEPLSHEVLENYISKVPGLSLVSGFSNAIDALLFLNSENVDLIFLDINMPELSGLSMLKTLSTPPMVIFITAHSTYALDGFEMNAVDFLLKPFSLERFLKAVNKADLHKKSQTAKPVDDFISVKADKKLYRIRLDSIHYFESAGDYVKIKTAEKVYIANETLKYFEQSLPENLFIRIHRSFIVSIVQINYVEGNEVVVAGTHVPVSQAYKEYLLSRIR